MSAVKAFFQTGWKYTIVGAAIPTIWFVGCAMIPYPWNGLFIFAYLGALIGTLVWIGIKYEL